MSTHLIHRVNVGDLVTRSAQRFPQREMICDGDRRWSYREFDAWTNRVAHGLSALGLRKGDALALMSGNCAEFLAVYFACARLGLVCVPINLLWRQHELSHVLADSRARAAVVEAGLLQQFCAGAEGPRPPLGIAVMDRLASGATTPASMRDVPLFDFDALVTDKSSDIPDVEIEDRAPLSYLYTSGTTSAPKGVIGTHLAIYLESLGTAIDTRMTENDRLSVVLPLFHTAQLNALCTPAIAVGASMVIQRGFDAATLHEAIETERISVLFALPMMIQQLVERQLAHPRNVGSLRLTVYAMAPMPVAELRRAIEIFGCDFSLMFGQTEMSPVSTFFKPEHQLSHAGAVGTPAVNVEVAIMAPDGALLPAGSAGEIVYRSPQTMAGYLHNPEATAEAFRHGWFHSGDAGRFDDDGILWFEDRFKDVIKTGGENVSSIEVELAIRAAHPDVLEVAAIGLPHQRWGEAITAVVVTQNGGSIDTDMLLSAVRERLSPFKCPKAVIHVPELPKTATGKIEKAKLRRIYAAYYG
ncbi:AMP-binding protein [Bradyrhizobium genosp. P]|uniref:AMP-binding protein n=1 Tax=Bradyrhizobium genosp. P TaxID=83641 RepID=UPI003CF77BC3